MKICLLHAELRYDDPQENLRILLGMCEQSLTYSPDVILMPELAISGYEFEKQIGVDWIKQQVPGALALFSEFAQQHSIALIVGSPFYDPAADRLTNAAILFGEDGRIRGKHNKISVLPGSESWAEKGTTADPIPWNDRKMGVLICADMYTDTIVEHLAKQGAEVIFSPANWGPGFHEPGGEWEERSLETGLTVVVCNRTGMEDQMDFRGAVSAVVVDGKRVLTYDRPEPAVLHVEFDADWKPLSSEFDILLVE